MSKDDEENRLVRRAEAVSPHGEEDTYAAPTRVVPVTRAEVDDMMRAAERKLGGPGSRPNAPMAPKADAPTLQNAVVRPGPPPSPGIPLVTPTKAAPVAAAVQASVSAAFQEIDTYDTAATQVLADRPQPPLFVAAAAPAGETQPLPLAVVNQAVREVEQRGALAISPPPANPPANPPAAPPVAATRPVAAPSNVEGPWLTVGLVLLVCVGLGLFITGLTMFLTLH